MRDSVVLLRRRSTTSGGGGVPNIERDSGTPHLQPRVPNIERDSGTPHLQPRVQDNQVCQRWVVRHVVVFVAVPVADRFLGLSRDGLVQGLQQEISDVGDGFRW